MFINKLVKIMVVAAVLVLPTTLAQEEAAEEQSIEETAKALKALNPEQAAAMVGEIIEEVTKSLAKVKDKATSEVAVQELEDVADLIECLHVSDEDPPKELKAKLEKIMEAFGAQLGRLSEAEYATKELGVECGAIMKALEKIGERAKAEAEAKKEGK